MEYRRIGASGLAVSEIAYGNWLTHDAPGCVAAALDAGHYFTTYAAARERLEELYPERVKAVTS